MSPAREPVRVFLADDSELLRTQIERSIREMGRFPVVGSASTAREAIAAIRSLRPEVLVLDLQLAEGTGWGVLDGAGDVPRHTLILTNDASPMNRAVARERGVQYVFDKTTQFDEFLECLSGLADPTRNR